MEEKIIILINKLENILIKDKRFENDSYFKSKVKKINKGKKDKELNSNKPIDISVLFNLAQLSQAPTHKKEIIYVNDNIDLTEHINFINGVKTVLNIINTNAKTRIN